jgi:hypothetical protein
MKGREETQVGKTKTTAVKKAVCERRGHDALNSTYLIFSRISAIVLHDWLRSARSRNALDYTRNKSYSAWTARVPDAKMGHFSI